jgi:hypothetical protein
MNIVFIPQSPTEYPIKRGRPWAPTKNTKGEVR